MAGGSLHEDESVLEPEFLVRHRVVLSLIEELEAVDWYGQRLQARGDPGRRHRVMAPESPVSVTSASPAA